MTWLDRKLARIANKSRVHVAVPIIFDLALMGILLMYTIEQSFPINEAGTKSFLNATFGSFYNDVCQNRLVQKLSPFLFFMHVDIFNEPIGLLGCPWRIRNTTYRLVVICLMSLVLLWMLAILLFVTKTPNISQGEKPQSKIWKFLCISQYVLFFGMIVCLILDCDAIWNGFRLCKNNFDMNIFEGAQGATIHLHDNNVMLNLLSIEWRTTMPPWCPKRAIGDGLGADYDNDNFKIVRACYLTPWIYTCIVDFGVVLLSFLASKFSALYLFGTYQDNGNKNGNGSRKIKNIISKFKFNIGKKGGEGRDRDGSMADRDGNISSNHGEFNTPSINGSRGAAIMSPAYDVDGCLYDNELKLKKEAMPTTIKQ